MPRNWLRNLSDRLSAKPTRKQIRRTRKAGGASIQPLEARVLLAAPRITPGQNLNFNVQENIGVNGFVQNAFTINAISDNYVDPVTGVSMSNLSNGDFLGRFAVDANDAGESVVSATVPGLNSASPISVILNGNFVEMYVNNFEHFNVEDTTSIAVTIRLTDNHGPAEQADVTVNVNIISSPGTNDIPYIGLVGSPNSGRSYQNFTIDENAAAGTVTNGVSGINGGGILFARTALRHEPTSTSFVNNVSPNGIVGPTGTLIPGQVSNNDNTRTDIDGQVDTATLEGVEYQTLRYQIVRALSQTTTNGVNGVSSEVQRILKDFDLESGQFLLSFASGGETAWNQTVRTVTQGSSPSTNEVQQIDFGNVTNGSFYTLTFRSNTNPSNSFTTRPIFYNATAAQVKAELELLGGVGVNNVKVEDVVQIAETVKGGGGLNEKQSLTIPIPPKNGNFFLSFNGQTTAAIASGASAATVKSRLEALSTIGGVGGTVNVTGTGVTGDPYIVEFTGALSNVDVNSISSVGGFNITFQGSLSGANQNQLVMTSYTRPLSYVSSTATIQAALRGLPTVGTPGNANVAVNDIVTVNTTQVGGGGLNEVQTVNVNNVANTSTFRLNFTSGGATGGTFSTIALSSTASAAQVQAALQALPNIGTGNVSVTGGGGSYVVQFVGALANTNVGQLANTEGWTLSFQGALANQDVDQIGVLNLSDLIEISNDLPTLGRISVSPTAVPFMVGSRLDGANGLNSGFEFLRDYFGLTNGQGDNTADFLALVRTFDRSGTDPLTQTKFDQGLSLTYDEYVRVTVLDTSEAAPSVQDEVYRINEFAPNSGTTNGLIVGKLNDFQNVSVTTTTPPTNGGNEVQTITAVTTGATNPGSYVLRFRGQQTSRILYTDSAATIKQKLEALSTIGAGNVMVSDDGNLTDGTNTYTVTFQGALGQEDVPQLEVFNGVSDGDNNTSFSSEVYRYNIVGGDPNGAFAINNTTGEITVANASLLSFESSPSYRLLVQVTDTAAVGQLSTVVAVDINLNDINEQTTVTPNQNFVVRENAPIGTIIGSVAFSDLDLPQARSLVFEITNGNLPDSNSVPTFAIDPLTGQITVQSNELLDFETQPFFDLGIRITDRGDQNTLGVGTIRISVSDVNESVPVLNDLTFTLDENTTVGSIVKTFSGISFEPTQVVTYQLLTTGVPFSIGNTNPTQTTNQGQITLTSALDYELGPRRYDLLVKAQDSLNPALFDTAVFTIFVNDVNEQIDINAQSRTIAENSPAGTNVGAAVTVSDPDDADGILQGKVFQIVAGNTNNAFSINSSTGQIQVNNPAALNFETQGSTPFQLAIQVTDTGSPATADIDFVNITVTNVNDAPVVNDQFFSVLEHRVTDTLVGTVVASDEDAGQTLSYSIIGGNVGNAFRIDATTGQVFIVNPGVVDFDQNPSFNLIVQVTDNGNPVLTDTANVTVTVTESTAPPPPIINDQTLNLNEGSPNGTVVGNLGLTGGTGPFNFFIVSGNTGNAFVIDNTNGNILVNNASLINFNTNPQFTLQVLVMDSSTPQLADQATVIINVTDLNLPPVLPDTAFSINENPAIGAAVGTVTATDPDVGDTVTYQIISGNIGGAFQINATTGQITVANPTVIDFEATPQFFLVVRATDSGSPAQSDDANVTINVTNLNEPPIVTNATFTIAENSPNATVVGTVSATDPDPGQSVTYSIVSGNTGGAFSINPVTGEIRVANTLALDFETTPSFNLIIGATDNAGVPLTGQGVVTVNLTNVNEGGVIQPQTFNISENRPVGYVVGTVIAVDPDPGQTLTYAITAGNGAGNFAIDANTGVITVVNPTLNFEAQNQYVLTVTVTDNGAPVQSSSAPITINILDLNEQPTIIAPTTFTVSENRPAGYFIGQLNAVDQDVGQTLSWTITGGNPGNVFALSSTGQLTIASPTLNFESTPVVNLQVTVTDNGNPTQSRTGTVTINVVDLNEAPVFTGPASFNVAENRPVGHVVGTVGAVDPDAGQTLTFAITNGNTNGTFAIDAQTGVITVAVPTLNYEATPIFNLTVTATDNGSPTQTRARNITINVLDLNEAPTILPPTTFNINEGLANGTVIGTINATDQDIGQTLTYSITGGNTNNAFAIDAATGQIRVLTSAAVDFETTPVFNLLVTVTDNGNPQQAKTATVTINLIDKNENVPVINPQSFSVTENSPVNTVVGTVVATDADPGQTLTYSIVSGNTNNAFKINAATGQILVNNPAAINFETIKSFPLIVKVTDNGSPVFSAQNTVTINVLNLNETPIVNDQTFTVPENTVNGNAVATVTATDPDGDPNLIYQIIGGNPLGAFSVDPNSGVVRVANKAALDYEARTSITFTLKVTDSGNPGLSDTANITFLISNQNDPPVIAPQTFTIGRSNPNGSLIGKVIASDQDAGQTLTYSITSGNTGGAFSISSANGQLFVANRNALIGRSQIPITVTVRDNGPGNFQASAVITVKIVAGTTPAPTSAKSSSLTAATTSSTPASQTVTTSSASATTPTKKTTTTSSPVTTDSGSSSLIAKATAPVIKSEN